jgi:hypothetical protein
LIQVDFNILIGVIVVFAIGAYVLVLRKMRAQLDSMETVDPSEPEAKAIAELETAETREAPPPSLPNDLPPKRPKIKCSHRFGYLRSLPRKAEPPVECLQCDRIKRCKNRKSLKKTRTNRTITVLASNEDPEITS